MVAAAVPEYAFISTVTSSRHSERATSSGNIPLLPVLHREFPERRRVPELDRAGRDMAHRRLGCLLPALTLRCHPRLVQDAPPQGWCAQPELIHPMGLTSV